MLRHSSSTLRRTEFTLTKIETQGRQVVGKFANEPARGRVYKRLTLWARFIRWVKS